MIINGQVALNPYETEIDLMELVSIGDYIRANIHGVQFNLTENKEYRLLRYSGDLVMVKNDLDFNDWYSVDYFNKI